MPHEVLASAPWAASTYINSGLAILFVIILAQTGVLIGFWLPGDTLLLLAGYYTVSSHVTKHNAKAGPHDQVHRLSYWAVAALCALAAIIGAQIGYITGRATGPRIFDRPSRREYVERAHKVLARFGEGKATVACRYIPVVRTFMPPVLGVTGMRSRDFLVWNVVGALLWCPVVIALGRLLPENFPIDKLTVAVVVASLCLPLGEAFLRRRRRRRAAA
ncbi:MAG TPA: DedA family protein [Mycobacteriales bacterium]|nr:DedA family protein [Mycobacteriales bacterium]